MIDMKRIIAFVLLGLLVYAGGFVIYYAAVDLKINNDIPVYLDNIGSDNIHTGLVAEGSVYQVIEEVYTVKYQSRLFGVPIGKEITQHFYALPLGDSDNYKFMLIAASEQEDVEALERLKTNKPRERGNDDPALHVYGVMEETPANDAKKLKDLLLYEHPKLIGYDDLAPYRLESVANNHVIPYTFYIKHIENGSGADYIPLYIGIGMCAAGIGLAVLLILRIKDERQGY